MDYKIDALNYLPEFLKESSLMLSIIDCLNVLISNEQPYFEQINSAYNDTIFKTRNYSELSYEAKVEVIRELGFDYIIDILTLTDAQIEQLLIFFNLIYFLKGRKEGLGICLEALGIKEYTYQSWQDQTPKGIPFTALLSITGDNYENVKVLKKLKNFVRSYMLPWIDIVIVITVPAAPLYIYDSFGRVTKVRHNIPNTAERDFSVPTSIVAPTKFEDKNKTYYKSYTLTIETPMEYNITIDEEEIPSEQTDTGFKYEVSGKTSDYFRIHVSKEGYVDYTNHFDLSKDLYQYIQLVKKK